MAGSGKLGPAEHERTEEIAHRVMVRSAAGWRLDLIAKDIGLSVPTLRKHYGRELEDGWTMLQGLLLDAMMKAALAGKTAAAAALTDGLMAPTGQRMFGSRTSEEKKAEAEEKKAEEKPVKPAILGKKEARAMGAASAIEQDADLRPN